ncbi:sensor histidine kinase [Ideonella sp. A 288]|uniref:sensor histidine kinase n=1 Tax=Ideonella sp. A 288 TaxID=1962181 RepID=UPI001303BA8E|nr:histidine kinase dimerization/phosphoacceptor domain -containing protein [Ideonella sp. A 288]
MTPEPPLHAEQRRLEALASLNVLDSLPEPVFDAITATAAQACGMPIALVSLVDIDRQWFKSNVGLPGVEQTPRNVAFCDHAIRQEELLEIADARVDGRFASNPLVTGDPLIRFYAGAPIVLQGGERVGTVCVIDRQPRQLTEAQRAMLLGLARVASVALVDRQRQVAMHRELALSAARYRAIVEDQTEFIALTRPDGTLVFVNGAYARHVGLDSAQMIGRPLFEFVDPADHDTVREHVKSVAAAGTSLSASHRSRSASGDVRWVAWTSRALTEDADRAVLIHSVGRDITEQRSTDIELRAALREKEVLLKEVYHRVKNNLQLVQSLLSLQVRSSKDDSVRLALAESARRIRAMALVHEKLYQSGNLTEVSLDDYARDLLRQIDESAGASARGIRLVAAIEDRPCRLDSAIPFSLLVTELVFNALEHGFDDQQGGEIRVALSTRGQTPWLIVSDNGVGLRQGFDLGTAASMGLQLASALSIQLGGTLQAHSDGGAVFSTALPRL